MIFKFRNKTGKRIAIKGSNDITAEDIHINRYTPTFECNNDIYSANILKKYILIILIDDNSDTLVAALPTGDKTVYADIGIYISDLTDLNESNVGISGIITIDCETTDKKNIKEYQVGDIIKYKPETNNNMIIGLGTYRIEKDNFIKVIQPDTFYLVKRHGEGMYQVNEIKDIYSFMDSNRFTDETDLLGFIILFILIIMTIIFLVIIIIIAKKSNLKI